METLLFSLGETFYLVGEAAWKVKLVFHLSEKWVSPNLPSCPFTRLFNYRTLAGATVVW